MKPAMKHAVLLLYLLSMLEPAKAGIQGNVLLKDTYPVSALLDVNYGWGYSSITLKETFNKVVDVKMMQPAKATGYSNGTIEAVYRIRLCKTSFEYNKYISSALSVSGTYMAVTVKPSIKVLTNVKVSKLDTILIAHVDITTDNRVSMNPILTAKAQEIMDKSFIKFAQTYGTHYLKEVILGGKMILAMRFTSESVGAKKELEAKLGAYVGGFSQENEFSKQLAKLKENYSMEVSLLAQGGNVPPPEPHVGKGLEYAIKFAKSAMEISVVKEIHYTALWTIPGVPKEFKQAIFPLQATTEKILSVGKNLLKVDETIRNFQVLRYSDQGHFSSDAWKKLKDLQTAASKMYRDLERDFRVTVTSLNQIEALYSKYKNKGIALLDEIDQLVQAESILTNTDQFTLLSIGSKVFVSRDSNSYPTLSASSPIPIKVQEEKSTSDRSIHFGLSYSYYLVSPDKPGHKLCMQSNNWYVFWVPDATASETENKNCLWSVVNSSTSKTTIVSYGDKVLIYNKGFSQYIIGVSQNKGWLEDIPASQGSNPDHHWFIGKMP